MQLNKVFFIKTKDEMLKYLSDYFDDDEKKIKYLEKNIEENKKNIKSKELIIRFLKPWLITNGIFAVVLLSALPVSFVMFSIEILSSILSVLAIFFSAAVSIIVASLFASVIYFVSNRSLSSLQTKNSFLEELKNELIRIKKNKSNVISGDNRKIYKLTRKQDIMVKRRTKRLVKKPSYQSK